MQPSDYGHARREDVYGAVFALEQKLGLAAAALLGGYLVTQCGYRTNVTPSAVTLENFRLALVFTPLIGVAGVAICIAFYPLTRARVTEIQGRLAEQRRTAAMLP